MPAATFTRKISIGEGQICVSLHCLFTNFLVCKFSFLYLSMTTPTAATASAMSGLTTTATGQMVNIPPSTAPSHNKAHPIEADSDKTTLTKFLHDMSIDARFSIECMKPSRPLYWITVNFAKLRTRLTALIIDAYIGWDKLRESLLSRVSHVDDYITDSAGHLATATVMLLYSHLRVITGKFDVTNVYYRTRCTLDSHTEIPSGLIDIIHCFGVALVQEVWNNPMIIHSWDHADAGTFGIPTANALDHQKLTGFLSILKKCGVPLSRLKKDQMYRSCWDSLLVSSSDNHESFDVMTTLPNNDNYSFPRDIFLAIGICGITTIPCGSNNPIGFYGPRGESIKDSAILNAILGVEPDPDSTSQPKKRARTSKYDTSVDKKNTEACLPFGYMHPSGIHLSNGDATRLRSLVYGRGDHDSVMLINSVARGVTKYEVSEFYRLLFRHGM